MNNAEFIDVMRRDNVEEMYKFIERDYGHLEPLEAIITWKNSILQTDTGYISYNYGEG